LGDDLFCVIVCPFLWLRVEAGRPLSFQWSSEISIILLGIKQKAKGFYKVRLAFFISGGHSLLKFITSVYLVSLRFYSIAGIPDWLLSLAHLPLVKPFKNYTNCKTINRYYTILSFSNHTK
jgi:hypothetical protein